MLRKNQTNVNGEKIIINGKNIKSEELFGVTLDHKLDFDTHISNLCKKVSKQLNILNR